MKVPIKRVRDGARLPRRAHATDAGWDASIAAFARIEVDGDERNLVELDVDEYELQPLERVACPLGFATAIPEGYYVWAVPRSGMAMWHGVTILNTPGTIDAGYRNEWVANVVNISNKPVKLYRGERILQLMLRKIKSFEFEEVDELPDSDRGLAGFGSTGRH
ncbi:MAG: dUTP diphosphatase [Promethearchaeota archaeon]